MCGIAGIIDLQGRPVIASALKQMTDAIRHRGPDGEGFFIENNIGFGHRRLAIIDLSDAGKQPMQRGNLVLTYNGEIYNYLELRDELKKKGYQFFTGTDSEVLLAAYENWGPDCAQHFNGMWSFAIYDKARKEVFFSRDRFGEKPFYYTESGGRFIFCSEIKGLLPLIGQAELQVDAALNFLVFEQAEQPAQTFFKGINKLEAAHNAVLNLDSGNFKKTCYYSLNLQANSHQESFYEKAFLDQFSNAVELRLRSDVRVGTCLSGGLDSSFIAAIAAGLHAKKSEQPFASITAGLAGDSNRELHFAATVAQRFHLQSKMFTPSETAFSEALPALVFHQEEPFHSTSVAMQYFVMQAAHDLGLKVLLDGQGADEILMGYHLHLGAALRNETFIKALLLASRSLSNYSISPLMAAAIWGYHSHPVRKANWQRRRWKPVLKKGIAERLSVEPAQLAEASISESVAHYQLHDMFRGTLPMLLRYEDKNAMTFSVESRLPFLDHRLVEWCLSLPTNQKIANGWSKHLLRQTAAPLLGSDVAWRKKKVGFEAPESFVTSNKNFLLEVVRKSRIVFQLCSHVEVAGLPDAFLWRLASLALWEEAFQVNLREDAVN